MDTKLILENQLAIMNWMRLTGMATTSDLREQIKATERYLADWEAESRRIATVLEQRGQKDSAQP